jgi:hypothetical protein
MENQTWGADAGSPHAGALADGGMGTTMGPFEGEAVPDGGRARAHVFAAADIASGLACLPDRLPPA